MADLELKIVAIFVIIATALIGGLLPLRFRASPSSARWLALGNAFAAGVFLGAGALHLLPDSEELLAGLDLPEYPWPFLLAGVGFLLVYFLEHVVAADREEDDTIGASGSFPVVLFLVLSVHSFIAGMALGLESQTAASIAIIVAIVVHKGFAAFALGVSIVERGISSSRAIRAILAFAVVTPIGILVGSAFGSVLESDASKAAEGIFDALAAGTFLYIATVELLGSRKPAGAGNLAMFVAIVSGFVAMALLAIWA